MTYPRFDNYTVWPPPVNGHQMERGRIAMFRANVMFIRYAGFNASTQCLGTTAACIRTRWRLILAHPAFNPLRVGNVV